MKTPRVSHGILEINYKSPPCLIWISPNKLRNNPLPITMTEHLPYFIVKFKIKCLPASRLSIAFSDTDWTLQHTKTAPYVEEGTSFGVSTTHWHVIIMIIKISTSLVMIIIKVSKCYNTLIIMALQNVINSLKNVFTSQYFINYMDIEHF